MPTLNSRVLGVAARYAYDTVRRPRPETLDDVPATPRAATPEWLTLALCADSGVTVRSARYEPISTGTSTRGRFHMTYDGPPGAVAQFPPTIFAKSTPGLLTRLQVGVTGGAEAEIRSYTRVLPGLGVQAPTGYFGKAHRKSGRSLLLIEDLGADPQVVFGDPRSVHIDRRRAEQLVETLARVHAALLGSPRFQDDLRWLRTSLQVQEALNASVDFARRVQVGIDRAEDLPPALVQQRHRLHERFMHSLSLDEQHPRSLMHTDVHAGNWYLTDSGMGLFDWTAVAKGHGPRDLAYALSSNLTTEDRRVWERDLVALYADRTAELSGSAPDHDAAWESYRKQMLWGVYHWFYTLGGGRLQPKMQPDDLSRVTVQRTAQAADDLDTVKSLER